MKVRATAQGYYVGRRRLGDEFLLTSKDHFSKRWMEEVSSDAKAPVEAEAPKEPKKKAPSTGDKSVI